VELLIGRSDFYLSKPVRFYGRALVDACNFALTVSAIFAPSDCRVWSSPRRIGAVLVRERGIRAYLWRSSSDCPVLANPPPFFLACRVKRCVSHCIGCVSRSLFRTGKSYGRRVANPFCAGRRTSGAATVGRQKRTASNSEPHLRGRVSWGVELENPFAPSRGRSGFVG
jgi:hypothetical protein